MPACTHCGSDVDAHDPVYVHERISDDRDAREQTGQFCNYACLAQHIEEEELTVGACCEWRPD